MLLLLRLVLQPQCCAERRISSLPAKPSTHVSGASLIYRSQVSSRLDSAASRSVGHSERSACGLYEVRLGQAPRRSICCDNHLGDRPCGRELIVYRG